MLLEMEKNIASRRETDRIMWFSMWILLSAASFGLVWFPMIYFLIKRRNDHFSRQNKLETLIVNRLRRLSNEKPQHQNSVLAFAKSWGTKSEGSFRNARAWTLATLLVFPAFYVLYFLKKDLQKHEEHEHAFLAETISIAQDWGSSINSHDFTTARKFTAHRYLILTIATCGFAALYWLYRIFNDYNQHFKEQWKREGDLLTLLTSIEGSKAR
jgi:hypothetical protein